MQFTRITIDPGQMDGVPCIRGLRIPVATVVGMVADGMADSEILGAHPDLEPEDIREALRYAAEALRERDLPLVVGRWSSRSTTLSRRWWRRGCDGAVMTPCPRPGAGALTRRGCLMARRRERCPAPRSLRP